MFAVIKTYNHNLRRISTILDFFKEADDASTTLAQNNL